MDLTYKLKIAVIMPGLSTGGAERVVANYLNWLVENTNSQVYLLVFEKLQTIYSLNPEINIIEGNITNHGKIKGILKRRSFLTNSFKTIKPDIIFTTFAKCGFYAYLSKPKNSVLISSERANLLFKKKLDKILSLLVAKVSNGFIFQTERARLRYPKNIQEKSIIISNPVPDHAILESQKNVSKEKVITAMGRLTWQKGFDILIQAFAKVSINYPEYKLVIYGEGEERNNLTNLIKDLNLEDKVFLVGNKDNAIEGIAKSKIFVLSSRYEGMPNALLEAMAVGTICIATDCEAGPSELITNYQNGILVPVDDVSSLTNKLEEILKNPDLGLKIETNAKKVLQTNSKDEIFKKFYDYMEDVYFRENSVSNTKMRRIINRFYKALINRNYLKLMPDKAYLKLLFKIKIGYKLNLDNPKTFNEKLQWLKLNDKNDYTNLVDKYEVRNYIKETIGEEYLIPLLGVYDDFKDIDFSKLPNQFVIKCNHDSGGVVVCKDKSKFDKEKARKKIEKCLKTNFFYSGREFPYKNIKPKIIIEKYMEDREHEELIDYKIMCFNGLPKIVFTCTERFSSDLKVTFFDLNWNLLPIKRHYNPSEKEIKKPLNYDKMLEFSKILAKDIPFVRVDFYEINGKLYFGELTFYPGSGLEEFDPIKWDYYLGNMLKLDKGDL